MIRRALTWSVARIRDGAWSLLILAGQAILLAAVIGGLAWPFVLLVTM